MSAAERIARALRRQAERIKALLPRGARSARKAHLVTSREEPRSRWHWVAPEIRLHCTCGWSGVKTYPRHPAPEVAHIFLMIMRREAAEHTEAAR